VLRTRVGYSGGTTPNPTYDSIGDHTETVQVDYDPARVSYQDLLSVFFGFHNPCMPTHSTQYKAVVFADGPEQQALAQAALDAAAAKYGQDAQTAVLPLGEFYLAEDYHQKYALRQYRTIAGELTGIYPRLADFIDSTAATRANAFAYGYGNRELLDDEIDSYGLSAEAQATLRELVR
jgi:peptide-methionine (S)-S-oxide reductase